MSHVTYMNESCHTHKWVMWLIVGQDQSRHARIRLLRVSHVTYINESCHIHEWVKSYHIHEWVMSQWLATYTATYSGAPQTTVQWNTLRAFMCDASHCPWQWLASHCPWQWCVPRVTVRDSDCAHTMRSEYERSYLLYGRLQCLGLGCD